MGTGGEPRVLGRNLVDSCHFHAGEKGTLSDAPEGWIRDRLKELAAVMAVDVLDYAVLDNHLHVVPRNRPDLVTSWSDVEVVLRWWYLCPERREMDGTPAPPLGRRWLHGARHAADAFPAGAP